MTKRRPTCTCLGDEATSFGHWVTLTIFYRYGVHSTVPQAFKIALAHHLEPDIIPLSGLPQVAGEGLELLSDVDMAIEDATQVIEAVRRMLIELPAIAFVRITTYLLAQEVPVDTAGTVDVIRQQESAGVSKVRNILRERFALDPYTVVVVESPCARPLG